VRNALLTRWERYNVELTRLEELAREGRAYIVYPDEMPLTSGTTDTRKLHEAYDHGHAQGMRELPRWREFLFGAPDAGPKPDPKVLREVEAEDEGYITISQ
jgi:predicted patatin/cPLA2 family phospholipase